MTKSVGSARGWRLFAGFRYGAHAARVLWRIMDWSEGGRSDWRRWWYVSCWRRSHWRPHHRHPDRQHSWRWWRHPHPYTFTHGKSRDAEIMVKKKRTKITAYFIKILWQIYATSLWSQCLLDNFSLCNHQSLGNHWMTIIPPIPNDCHFHEIVPHGQCTLLNYCYHLTRENHSTKSPIF